MIYRFVVIAAAAVLTCSAQPSTKTRPLAEFSSAIEELASGASGAVVHITAQTRALVGDADSRRTGFVASQQSTGSGVVIDPEGYVVTNAHVIEGARHIDISLLKQAGDADVDEHTHFAARIVGIDRDTDLALLKIDAHGLPTLSFVDSNTLRQGQFVVALGSPLGLENSLTVGFISAPVRHLRSDLPMFYIQTDAAINPGNSGGPLLDIQGRIAGINTLIFSQSGGSEGIGFAIPSNVVRDVCEHLRKEGRMRRASIGVIPEDITPTLSAALELGRHDGVILSDVAPHSAAEAAGLQPGDVIIAAGGRPIRDSKQLLAALFQHGAGDVVKLEISRGGQKIPTEVTMMERPRAPGSLTDLANQEAQLIRRLGVLALPLNERSQRALPELRRLSGVVVGAIPTEYAGSNPGLAGGDVIYECNGARVTSVAELAKIVDSKASGAPMALLVERNGQLVYVSFELD